MKFTPLRFQSALAAGGLALMPFVLMQFTFERRDKLIDFSDLAGRFDLAALFLVAVMLIGTLLHFYLIVKITGEFVRWRQAGEEMQGGFKSEVQRHDDSAERSRRTPA